MSADSTPASDSLGSQTHGVTTVEQTLGVEGPRSLYTRDGDELFTRASQKQLQFILNHEGLWPRFQQSLNYRFAPSPSTQANFEDQLQALVHAGLPDDAVYAQLRSSFHGDERYELCRNSALGDAWKTYLCKRVQDMTTLLPPGSITIESLLDVGCGDTILTRILAEAYGVKPSSAFGCDLAVPHHGNRIPNLITAPNIEADEDEKDPAILENGCNFQLFDGVRVPVTDNGVDFVSALLVLHHAHDLDALVADIFRALRPGGYFMIFESDCTHYCQSIFIDVMHALRARVWRTPPYPPGDEFAQHHSRGWWTNVLARAGFEHVLNADVATRMYEQGNEPKNMQWCFY